MIAGAPCVYAEVCLGWTLNHYACSECIRNPARTTRVNVDNFKTTDHMKETEEPKDRAETLEKNVNHPTRYTKGKVECIDAIDSAVIGKPPDEAVCVANVIKYLWRYEEKEPLRSAMSAAWYLARLIGKLKAKETR